MNSVRHLVPREHRIYVVLRQIRVLVVAVAGLSGSLAMAADANHGSDLTKRGCATCHVVNSEQKQASTGAPPFAVIGSESDFTPERSPSSCSTPHPKMPSFPLSRSEAADLAAYIGSCANRTRDARTSLKRRAVGPASTAYLPHRNTSGPRRLAISINPARTAGCNG